MRREKPLLRRRVDALFTGLSGDLCHVYRLPVGLGNAELEEVKRLLPYLPYAVVALVAFGWFKAHDAKVRADALADARRDSLTSALDSAGRLTDRLTSRDSALAVHEAADRQRAAASRSQLAAATAKRDSTAAVLDSVLASLPETAPLSIAITNERQAGAACRLALTDCEALGLTLTARAAVLDSTVNVLEPALASTRRMWEAAERARHQSIFGKLRIALPFMGATALGVLLLK